MVKKVVTEGKDYTESITPKSIEKYLGIPRFRRAAINKENEIGAAVGMAWTEFGGELLTFEVTKIYGKGNFTLTGQLGEIMQESAQAAFSYVRGKMYELNIARDLHKNSDIHIHVPEGATPKDGPSAGITIATSIISLLLGIPVIKKIAMSGEITLKGKILPVGGIKEKILAAHREGIFEIILPIDNEPDLKDIPKNIKDNMSIHLVDNMDEVLKLALIKDIPKKVKKTKKGTPDDAVKSGGEGESSQEPSITH
jgi:ATP-dependent Lon protease